MLVQETVSSFDASYGRLQGASGQDLNHGCSTLVAHGGNNTSGEIDVSTAVKGDNNCQDFESETFVTHIDGGHVARPLKAEHDGMPTADGKGYDIIAFDSHAGNRIADECQVNKSPPVKIGSSGSGNPPAVCFQQNLGTQGGGITEDDTATTIKATQGPPAIAFKPSHYTRGKDGAPSDVTPPLSADADKGDQEAVVFQPRYTRNGRGAPDTVAGPLTAEAGRTGKGDSAQCVAYDPDTYPPEARPEQDEIDYMNAEARAFAENSRHELREMETAGNITSGGGKSGQGYPAVRTGMQVRRLTPTECERLQGFSDGYTDIPWKGKPAPDGHRYRALGNSMAVPVMRWLGERIQMVEDML